MNNFTSSMKKQSGFTLIEIAIVLVIVGLLLGGVLQGQQLIENSRVRAAVNDFTGIPAAAYSYMDRFRRFPGDDGPIATVQGRGAAWATTTAAGNANGVLAGNIGNTLNPVGELLGFWQQLRASGFIAGNPATIGREALPANPFGGVTGVSAAAMQGMPVGVVKVCMNSVGGTAALSLDTRLDDGVPNTGTFRANAAIAPNATAAIAYNEDLVYTVCKRI